ncbi:MAG: NAD(P)/FAD-dependent oxidoreductase [Candidatus Thorarchaeota archaeon]|nr:NAD(P)/FAD-dependent oxidoreductase [Candidatus Thorarchaeota archaeon]
MSETRKATKVVVVGAGIAGFSCALELKALKARCTILEKESTVGGRARSFTESGYVFDQGLHFFVGGFKSLIPILERSGVRMTKVGEGAVWLKEGERHSITSSFLDMARFGLLSTSEKLTMKGLMDENLKRTQADFLALDKMTFEEYAQDKIPESIYENFYDPLIRTVTFMKPKDVSAGQYLYSEQLRFAYEDGFSAWYPERGGLGSVPYTLMLQARNFAIEPKVNCNVKQIIIDDGKVVGVDYEQDGKDFSIETDAAVITTPVDLLPNFVDMNKLPSDFSASVRKFSYRPSIVAYFGLSSRVLDFNVGGFIPGKKIHIVAEAKRVSGVLAPIGESLLTVTSIDEELLKMENDEATTAILEELTTLIPGIEEKVTWKKSWKIWRSVLSQPPGIMSDRLTTNRTGIEGLYVAGAYANCGTYYASMEAASKSGIACASEMIADFS